MTEAAGRLPIGLAAYSFSYSCGFAGAGTPRACTEPYTVYGLMDLTASLGLGGIEFPLLRLLPSLAPDELARAREYAASRGLFLVVDAGIVDVEELSALLPAAEALGARTVRAVVSSILEGDRRAMRDTWPQYLAEIATRLRAVLPLAEQSGVAIALENHQDVTSEELVALCDEIGSPLVGVNLDTINPLAVAEEPLAFARRVAPYLKNVHLKDYRLYSTPQGYRLVSCAVGAGVLDVRGILDLCAAQAPTATICIEIGALQARHVRFLEDDFWPGYPPRQAAEILPVLRLREARARPRGEDWRSPWERGEQGPPLVAHELTQVEESVEYLRSLQGR